MAQSESQTDSEKSEKLREIRFEHSPDFATILKQLGISLLLTTYQAGKMVVVGTDPEGKLSLSFENFEQCMGVAVRPGMLAVGARQQVWYLSSAPQIAAQLPPTGRHDACYLARSSHLTGPIDGHEMAWVVSELWMINTLFSCLCSLDDKHSFVPRWRPKFISGLAAEDRCHLNGLCVVDGKPKYVTALGETDTDHGWRPGKATGGVIIDIESNEVVTRGLAMAHSPRVHNGKLWVLDSGLGALANVDLATGQRTIVNELPGYCRGMSMFGPFAFIGLSKIRETSTFGGIPIAERRAELKCGVGVVDLRSGRAVAALQYVSGVDELFDVQVLPNTRLSYVSGPYATVDGKQNIWCVPAPR